MHIGMGVHLGMVMTDGRDGSATRKGTFFHADHVSVRAVPGAVFLRLHKLNTSGLDQASAYIELTPGEVLSLRHALDECVGLALVAGERGASLDIGLLPGMDDKFHHLRQQPTANLGS